MLASSCARAHALRGDGGNRASAHRGERVISRKAIAQGMSDALRCPVCSCAASWHYSHTRPRVQRASGIPCALLLERAGSFLQASGAMRRENAKACLDHGATTNTAVVPAKAGTHTPRPLGEDAGVSYLSQNERHGVWVPAFAGTTNLTSRKTSAARADLAAADRRIRQIPAGPRTVLPAPSAIPRTARNRHC